MDKRRLLLKCLHKSLSSSGTWRTLSIFNIRTKSNGHYHRKELINPRPNRLTKVSSRGVRSKDGKDLSSLFVPLTVKPNQDDANVGEELTEKLDKRDLMRLLTQFYQRKQVKQVCVEQGLDKVLYHQAFMSFRRYCLESESLPVDLHVVLSDVIQGAGHVDDIVPYFIRHARQIFPHLECMDDLKKIGDLTAPPNWYPEARKRERKIIFHAGPTNSGKTYHALERFLNADSGVYCGPLKLLATEVYEKANEKGTPCDLVTGEERKMANEDGSPSRHVSCTVEMTSVNMDYTVAIIDEIQMLRDQQRGWAWTRALLGVSAEEVHVCGEPTAVEMVRDICISAGEELEVRRYKRLTGLNIEDEAIGSFDNIQAGDCIVCFSKNDIYYVSRELEKRGTECGVIYGALPPGTKLAQAKKFNDPENPCKVLVATDAIGMGLNLSIRRVVFYSLMKANINEKGEKEMDTIPTHLALQIGGRAGRYGTPYPEGYVTTFKPEDLPVLKSILSRDPEAINRAGLHPTADQIELYAYNLPNATLSNLVDIFVNLCTVDDSLYFMCQLEDFKFMADMIQHVPLPLRARYVFCCAPINKKMPFVCTMFLKFARQFSNNEPITYDWLCFKIGWPFSPPQTIMDLIHLEAVFDVLDLYLWFSYRFLDIFPDASLVRDTQKELDAVIQEGVFNITRLLRQSEAGRPSAALDDEESFQMQTRHQTYLRGPRFLEEDNTQSLKFRGSPVLKTKAGRHKHVMEADSVSYGGGKLTERLISQGLLTPHMIEELRRELVQEKDPDRSKDNDNSTNRGHKKR